MIRKIASFCLLLVLFPAISNCALNNQFDSRDPNKKKYMQGSDARRAIDSALNMELQLYLAMGPNTFMVDPKTAEIIPKEQTQLHLLSKLVAINKLEIQPTSWYKSTDVNICARYASSPNVKAEEILMSDYCNLKSVSPI